MTLRLTALVVVLALGLAVPTGAVALEEDNVEATQVDSMGALELAPHDGPNGAYASIEDGELAVEIDRLNDRAATRADDVFTITATAEERVTVSIAHDADGVTFYRGSDPDAPLDGDGGVTLSPGETVDVGIAADPRDDVSLDAFTVRAETAERDGGGAAFVVRSRSINRTNVTTGQAVRTAVVVENVGDASGVYTTELVVDGVVVDHRSVAVPAGERRTVTFVRRFYIPGPHPVSVGDAGATVEAREVTVTASGASFSVHDVAVSDERVGAGGTTTVTATVTNDGTEPGTFAAELVVADVVVATRHVSVDAGESVAVTFARTFDAPGRYPVTVRGGEGGTVTVGEPAALGDRRLPTPIAGAVVPPALYATVVLLGGSGLFRRRR